MEPEGSSPYSQVSAICPYHEPTPSSPHNPLFLKIHINIILPSTSGSPQWSLSIRFPHQNLVHTSPLPHTCPAHLILLDFTTRTILGKDYRSLSSSLCNFLHSGVKISFPCNRMGTASTLHNFVYRKRRSKSFYARG